MSTHNIKVLNAPKRQHKTQTISRTTKSQQSIKPYI